MQDQDLRFSVLVWFDCVSVWCFFCNLQLFKFSGEGNNLWGLKSFCGCLVVWLVKVFSNAGKG